MKTVYRKLIPLLLLLVAAVLTAAFLISKADNSQEDIKSTSAAINETATVLPELSAPPTAYITDEEKLFDALTGKNISVLGDSISTFCMKNDSWSNNPKYNSTIASNDVWYNSESRISSVNDTYWKIIIDRFDMNLVVNNSYSGGFMSDSGWGNAGFIRAQQLHADVDGINKAGTVPDVVLIYMGTNDYDFNRHLGTIDDIDFGNYEADDKGNFTYDSKVKSFTDAYAYAIYKINCLYNNPDVFVITLLPNGMMPESVAPGLREKYNNVIKSMADIYGNVTAVDLDERTPINGKNYYNYYADGSLHPNEEGMLCIADAVYETVKEKYTG